MSSADATGGQEPRIHKMVLTALSNKDLLPQSQALFPSKVRAWYLAVRSKHAVLWLSTVSAFQRNTAKFQYWVSFGKTEIYLQLHEQDLA